MVVLIITSCSDDGLVVENNDDGPAIEKNRLTVLTYNIHHGAPSSGSINLDQIAAVIKLSGAEVVALQEVDVKTGRSGGVDQAEKLAELLGMEYYFSRSINFDEGEYGNVILSRHPLTDTRRLTLPMPTREPRSVGLATVTLPNGQTFEFGATHFEAGNDHSQSRLAQSRFLNDLSKDLDKPLIIGGDYNAVPTSTEMVELKKEFDFSCVNSCPFTFPERNPNRAIDFVIYNRLAGQTFSLVSGVAMTGQYASDHLPMLAVFEYD